MRVLISNQSGMVAGHLAGRFPGQLGHLYSPGGERGPWEFMPYALDNGAFPAFTKKEEWNELAWLELLEWAIAAKRKPEWVLVPDVVGDAAATIKLWREMSPLAATVNVPLAFAVQNGMQPDDVPEDADVVFLGGSKEWKWPHVYEFCDRFPRVHVGRVNTFKLLEICRYFGAESCDGTGWFRGDQDQLAGLVRFLEQDRQRAADDDYDPMPYFHESDPPTASHAPRLSRHTELALT